MTKNVLIAVKSTRTDLDNETDVIEAIYPGTLHFKNNNYFILYKETERTGMENVSTTLKTEGHKVTIIRNGNVSMRQVFERDMVHQSCYQTPYGNMEMTVKPWYIEVHLTDIGGSIKLEYELELDGAPMGKTSLDIVVTEAPLH